MANASKYMVEAEALLNEADAYNLTRAWMEKMEAKAADLRRCGRTTEACDVDSAIQHINDVIDGPE